MKKALIVEHRACHQELFPTWVWALGNLGYEVHVFVARSTPNHRNILSCMRSRMGLQFVTAANASRLGFDLIVNNSLYPDEVVQNGDDDAKAKVLSVLHTLAPKYRDLEGLRHPQHCIIALGPHLHNALNTIGVANFFAPPIYFGPPLHKQLNAPRRVVVQGTMEVFRRNYGCIAQLINQFGARFPDMAVHVLGERNEMLERWLMQRLLPETRSQLQLTPRPNYDAFLDALGSAGWVMPCVDETFQHGYFSDKITSSVMLAIGNGVPLLLHRKLADIYGLRDGVDCICYESFSHLEAAFERAMTLTPDAYAALLAGVLTVRAEWLKILDFNFRQFLE